MISNPGEKHMIYMLLVDTSGSMAGAAIDELNEVLRLFGEKWQAMHQDYVFEADICVVKFDSTVEVVVPFASAAEYQAPTLQAGGLTALNEAIITALDLVEQRKEQYRLEGVSYWRPWMFLLTDGVPTDSELSGDALNRLQEALQKKKVTFFPMGIGSGADLAALKSYTRGGQGEVLQWADVKDNEQIFRQIFWYTEPRRRDAPKLDQDYGYIEILTTNS